VRFRPAQLRPAALTTLFMAVAMAAYLAIAHDGRDAVSTRTSWDEGAPLWPWTSWIYVSPYLIAPLLLARSSLSLIRRVLARGIAVLVPSLLVFALLPTLVERPSLEGLGGLSVGLLEVIYTVDTPPRNAAPSGHVSLTLVLAWGAWRGLPHLGARVLAVLYVLAVCASTVLTGQHHVLDVLTGAALTAIVLALFAWRDRRADPRAHTGAAPT
jgi:membrane-associated phospholipid phosphatase